MARVVCPRCGARSFMRDQDILIQHNPLCPQAAEPGRGLVSADGPDWAHERLLQRLPEFARRHASKHAFAVDARKRGFFLWAHSEAEQEVCGPRMEGEELRRWSTAFEFFGPELAAELVREGKAIATSHLTHEAP